MKKEIEFLKKQMEQESAPPSADFVAAKNDFKATYAEIKKRHSENKERFKPFFREKA